MNQKYLLKKSSQSSNWVAPVEAGLGLSALRWPGETKKGRTASGPRASELREDVGGQAAGEACAIRLHIQSLHYTIFYHHGEPVREGKVSYNNLGPEAANGDGRVAGETHRRSPTFTS